VDIARAQGQLELDEGGNIATPENQGDNDTALTPAQERRRTQVHRLRRTIADELRTLGRPERADEIGQ
jgi:hypothetical protein